MAETPPADQLCEWFAMCARPATVYLPHPILGPVPACGPCARRASPDDEVG